MNQKVIVLWKAPNIAVAERGPRVLENLDREGKTHFYAPRMDEGGNILYDLDEEYARRLLAGQGDRFFLVSPSELIVKRKKADGLSAEYVTLKAITALGNPPPSAQAPVSNSPAPEGTTPPAETPATGSETGQAAPQDARHTQQEDARHAGGSKKPKATAA